MRQVVLLARPLPLPSAGRLAGSPARKGAGWDDREDPERVPLTVRILTETDERLTAAARSRVRGLRQEVSQPGSRSLPQARLGPGTLCRLCNARMALVDRGVMPDGIAIEGLLVIARRCPECPPVTADDLAPARGGRSAPVCTTADLDASLMAFSAGTRRPGTSPRQT
jgi:hypothetical protein